MSTFDFDAAFADIFGEERSKSVESHSVSVGQRLTEEGISHFNATEYAAAYRCFKEAAEKYNNDVAQRYMGEIYFNGYGVEQDYEEAVKWYSKAAEQGDADAQNNLGYCYYFGEGVEQDYEEAVKWYTKAAEQGDAEAQFELAGCYERGEGVCQDFEEALKWYTKAAKQGQEEAQKALERL